MPLVTGARLGPYEIIAPLGAGGMGEVYKAKDTRLDRTVAIKVLPLHLSSRPESKARFEREARAVSALNHPHICVLHDIGSQDGVDYLVLELLEGETLATKLERGPLSLEQALKTAVEIADALERAHKSGIVHRDLKPGNIMMTKSGAKLMDFGLARAAGTSTPGDSTQSPTMSQPLTAEGTILGTFQYMAPEQLEGSEADVRTDLFALGAVIYEMATGRKAFSGKSQASLISAIMASHPEPISSVRPMTPAALDRLVRQCLEKDPDDRWQSAGDVKRELLWIASGAQDTAASATSQVVPRRRSPAFWLGIAALTLVAAAAGLAVGLRWRTPAPVHAVRASVLPPAEARFDTGINFASPLAISPDGTRIAFTASQSEGPVMLWVRSVKDASEQMLSGTGDAALPFWSPDGKWIGFFSRGKLKKIEAGGGTVFTLAEAPETRGGTWAPDGTILFSPSPGSTLYKVSATGGPATEATKFDAKRQENTHRFPQFLPDGRHFIYLSRLSGAGRGTAPAIVVGSLDSPETHIVMEAASNALYASGRLLYVEQGALVARKFNLDTLKLEGDPVILVQDIRYNERFSFGTFSVSQEGTLVLQTGKAQVLSTMTWMDRSGKVLGTVGEPAQYFNGGSIHISPDGTRILEAIVNDENGLSDIYIAGLRDGSRTRFTFGAADRFAAIWFPQGDRIAFEEGSPGRRYEVHIKPVTGMGTGEVVLAHSDSFERPNSVSPDGRYLVYEQTSRNGPTRTDILVIDMAGDRKPKPFLATPVDEGLAKIDPSGRFLVYTSEESGSIEIYVTTFPEPLGKWQVSQNGGTEPRWRGDGKEIYFFDFDNNLMAAPVSVDGAHFASGTPVPLFKSRGASYRSVWRSLWRYDVARDGQKFLVNTPVHEEGVAPLTLILNWPALLESP